MARTGASFYFCVDTIVEMLGAEPTMLQLPSGVKRDSVGVIDLVTMEAFIWRSGRG